MELAVTAKKKKKRIGRPPENKGGRDVMLYFYPENIEKMDKLAAKRGVSWSELVRDLITKAKG